MRIIIASDDPIVRQCLPPNQPDGSDVGINYADALGKQFRLKLEDGRKIGYQRRGLKIILKIGEETGEGLLRRLQHGPATSGRNSRGLDQTHDQPLRGDQFRGISGTCRRGRRHRI